MKRYLYDNILKDLKKKMIMLTGPRQVGKTYLAKQALQTVNPSQYLNYDSLSDARVIRQQQWPLNTKFLVLDEIHKMKNWKMRLKGIYDTKPSEQRLLVTGSSRMETFRQSGESLAGRYYHYHLYPLSVHELRDRMEPYDAVEHLNRFGGFPEPCLSGLEEEADRWRKQYYTDLVREDILEFSRIHEIKAIRLLLELLRDRVGSSLSYASLAGDLQISPNTVCKYIEILESLYIVFLIRPYHKNIARSILKAPKVYFYDSGFVKGDVGKRLENTCAVCLLKHISFLRDAKGKDIRLCYIRNKTGHEIDFAMIQDDCLSALIEVKNSTSSVSPSLRYFHRRLSPSRSVQLVHNLRQEQEHQGISVIPAGKFLLGLKA